MAVLLVAADAEALRFHDATFDAGVLGLATCTIPHPDRALAELRRVLRPGAPLRLLEYVRLEHPLLGRLQDWLTPVLPPRGRVPAQPPDCGCRGGGRLHRGCG